MSRDSEAAPRSIHGRQLACPVCKHTQFYTRDYLLNTRAATFFNFDWANRAAATYICEQCSHILWFLDDPDGGDA
jgi:C4-type Zn-finger protein